MKLGLVSVYNYNYGSLLQTYALQQVLIKNNVDNEIIQYKKKNIFKQFLRLFNYQLVVMKGRVVWRKFYCRLFQKEISQQLSIRDQMFENFIREKLIRSELYIGKRQLKNASEKYKAFLVGSDQVWNPINLGTDYFTLNWVPDDIKTASYGSSFGVDKIPWYQKKRTKKYLNKIDYLSTRESKGAELIKLLTGREATVVCDPTLLVDKECWEELKGQDRFVKEKYIFCYFLGNNKNHREFATRVKKALGGGYKIVALQHLDEFVKGDLSFGDETPYNVGPAEFVNLVSNAEIVLTDSFHGTIFSVLFKRKFAVLSRHNANSSGSTNSRLDNLLCKLKLEDCRVTDYENISSFINKEIDYSSVEISLDEYRKVSKDYFDKVIKEILC